MKFSTRQDIEAPIEYVFERASDFAAFERQALRRGIEVERDDGPGAAGPGMRWKAMFHYRGKPRKIRGELIRLETPHNFLIQSVSGGIEADFEAEFLPLSRNRTRLKIGLQLSPRTMSARLLVQSLKFAKSTLDARFEKRLVKFARDVQERHAGVNA